MYKSVDGEITQRWLKARKIFLFNIKSSRQCYDPQPLKIDKNILLHFVKKNV